MSARAGLAVAAGAVTGVGALALLASLRIPEGRGYTAVGPGAFPLIAATGLLVLGLLLLARITLWPDRELLRRASDEALATHWPAPLTVAAALLLYALALQPLGFVPATAPFFAGVAWTLGDRRPRRALGLGLLLALLAYLGFTRLLGIALPPGLLRGIL